MASAPSDHDEAILRLVAPTSLKLLVAGGFGVGKTTLVGAISEIDPLTTEAPISTLGLRVDDPAAYPSKTTTTVALDFGRITIADDLVLYLFGTPGQERFAFMWDELTRGAIGAVLLVDTLHLADSFPAADYFERMGLPFAVGVNCFDGRVQHTTEEVREALALDPPVPVVLCDARERESVKQVLETLVEYALRLARAELCAEPTRWTRSSETRPVG